MKRDLYRMNDKAPAGMFQVEDHHEAMKWCDQGWGIFWTIQEFDGPRKIENLKKINSWAVDIDGGDKKSQWALVEKFVAPSYVIETRNGLHIYWDAKDGTKENYQSIVADRLVYHFKADPRAKDLARVLRCPWYFHNKSEPFLCKVVYSAERDYTEAQMLKHFPLPEELEVESEKKQELRKNISPSGDTFWERIWNLDCEQGLLRLSGKSCVGS